MVALRFSCRWLPGSTKPDVPACERLDPAAGDKEGGSLPAGAIPQVQRPPQRTAPERRPIAIVAPPEEDGKESGSSSGQEAPANVAPSKPDKSDKSEADAQPKVCNSFTILPKVCRVSDIIC